MRIGKVLFSAEEIADKVHCLGERINSDFDGEDAVMVCVLKGSAVFFADLLRELSFPCTIDFISVSSYGGGTVSSGKLKVEKDIETDISGKNVIIVEDIVDTGITLSALKEMFLSRNPKSLKICSILNKPSRRIVPVDIDYCGYEIPDVFAVGYGLDYDQHYRQLPYIAVLSE